MKLRGQLLLVGTNHHTASVGQRERLSLDATRTAEFYAGIRSLPHVHESFVLNTCNRLEIYANIEEVEAIETITRFLCDFNRLERNEFESIRFQRLDLEAVTHLFEVASGVDSQIVGEAEILGQVKEAYSIATKLGGIGPVLNRLIQKSFQAAKWIRSHTAIGEGQINTATVAVDLAIKIFGRLDRNRVLIVGAGKIAEKTARALRSRGARAVTVTSRRGNSAAVLAAAIGGDSVPIDVIDRELGTFDIVVSSTSSPTPVILRSQIDEAMKQRAHRPFFLIDLAVPRDIDPQSGDLGNVYLYNIDDLTEIASENLAHRKAEVTRCRAVLLERSDRVWRSIIPRSVEESMSPSEFRTRPSD
jgi:glutamyl-tRNA reductase